LVQHIGKNRVKEFTNPSSAAAVGSPRNNQERDYGGTK
jgi:hypothetical protein